MEACDHAAMADNSDNSDADHDFAADTSASKSSIRRFVITEEAPIRTGLINTVSYLINRSLNVKAESGKGPSPWNW